MPTKACSGRALAIMAVACALGVVTTACTPDQDAMRPREARDVLVSTIQDTAAQLSVEGWNEDSAPGIQSCDSDGPGGVKYGYGYGAPQPDSDHQDDAEAIAEYWESLGMSVRVDTTHEPVVYGEGGPVQGLRFSTAPGDYYIAGTSVCVPGDANEQREEEYEQ